MMLQYMIIGIIVLSAVALTTARLIRFFSAPASKCEGCSGCAIKEIKDNKLTL